MNNPAASTSNGIAAAAQQQQQQILANNAADQIIAAHGPFLQIEQKKVLVFRGEKDNVTVMVIAWCAHMEAMKTSLGWSQDATFCNATAALFGNSQRVVNSWAILLAKYEKTWTYLKKAMIKQNGNMQDSPFYICALLNI